MSRYLQSEGIDLDESIKNDNILYQSVTITLLFYTLKENMKNNHFLFLLKQLTLNSFFSSFLILGFYYPCIKSKRVPSSFFWFFFIKPILCTAEKPLYTEWSLLLSLDLKPDSSKKCYELLLDRTIEILGVDWGLYIFLWMFILFLVDDLWGLST